MSKRKAVQMDKQVEEVKKAKEEAKESGPLEAKESGPLDDTMATINFFATKYPNDAGDYRKKLDGLEKMAKAWDADATKFDKYMIEALVEWFCGPDMGREKVLKYADVVKHMPSYHQLTLSYLEEEKQFYHYEHFQRAACQIAAIHFGDWELAKFTFPNILLTRLVHHQPKDNIANAKDEIANTVSKALCRMAFSWGKFAVPVKVDGRALDYYFIPTRFITQGVLKKVIMALIEKMNF